MKLSGAKSQEQLIRDIVMEFKPGYFNSYQLYDELKLKYPHWCPTLQKISAVLRWTKGVERVGFEFVDLGKASKVQVALWRRLRQ
jgi:hypothetical protein